MAKNRHTCLSALARQARLTKTQSGRQKNDDKPTPAPPRRELLIR